MELNCTYCAATLAVVSKDTKVDEAESAGWLVSTGFALCPAYRNVRNLGAERVEGVYEYECDTRIADGLSDRSDMCWTRQVRDLNFKIELIEPQIEQLKPWRL